jgi:hypothetical protein
MLCDDIAAKADEKKQPQLIRSCYAALTRQIRQSQIFVLSDAVADAAAQVAMAQPGSILTALPMCRLPFPKMWIEFASHARSTWTKADTPERDTHRIGFLVETRDDPQHGHMALAYAHPNGAISPAVYETVFDWRKDGNDVAELRAKLLRQDTTVEYLRQFVDEMPPHLQKIVRSDTAAQDLIELERRFALIPSQLYGDFWREIGRRYSPGSPPIQKLYSDALEDWAREPIFLMSALLLINTKNGTTVAPSDLDALNRKRRRLGRKPLFSYHTVELSLSKTQNRRLAAAGIAADERRAHLVRGHFKLRRSGVYWWTPHVRGNAKLGFVGKEYNVES